MAEMTDEPVYAVVVTREGDHWLADVPDLEGAHTYARTLPALDQAVREVVILAVDRPDEDVARLRIDYHYRTGDPQVDRDAAEVRTLRARSEEISAAASLRTAAAATMLVERGLTVRDVAAILGISPQRVSQITRSKAG